jgi:predicted dehydrogenase
MAKTTTGSGNRGSSKRKIRYAVVGQGYISQIAVLPAFAHARRNSELAALISDDPLKLKKLGRKYDVHRLYSYDQYDACLSSGEIDAVYIALPNNMHRDYTERAARAGVHILCEKPMAVTEEDCEAMIRAAGASHVKLMIAYRLHFEATNLKAVQIARNGKLGELRIFNSLFTMQVEKDNIRLKKGLGGGTLYDIGIKLH